jgi:ABC-type branched-subunit amino acid transport system ATPase component
MSATQLRTDGATPAVPGNVVGLPDGPITALPGGRYPVVALGLLAGVDGLCASLLPILAPEISAALGVSRPLLTLVAVAGSLLASLAGLGYAALALRRGNRSGPVAVAAAATAVATLAVAWVSAPGGLLAAQLALLALARGAVPALYRPLIADALPPGRRVRGLAAYRAATVAGMAVLPVALLGAVAALDLTWRAAFLASGVLTGAAALAALRLRDPGVGRYEAAAVAAFVDGGDPAAEPAPPFGEALRRTLAVPGLRLLLVIWAVVGMLSFPLLSFVGFLFDERYDTGPGGRAALVVAGGLAAVAALAAFGRRGDALLGRDPAGLVRVVGLGLAAGAAALLLTAASPAAGPAAVGAVAVTAAVAVALAALDVLTVTVVEPRLRVMASALAGVFLAGVGTVSGVLLLGGLDRRFGVRLAVAALALPALLGAFLARRAATGVPADLSGLAQREVARGRLQAGAARGEKFPLLSCEGIDFSYGQLQVLFDVTFTVDEGEMVALLGTNGAGKSTLLRVISGLGFPRRGSVSCLGQDITYLDAERRVGLGITQISGGHATFGPLDVVENLRVYGYTLGRSRRRIEESIDAAFDAFPRLAERRHNPAATLSGGEQQMLGLSKALILQPRLLLIDELSLGLAPVVVGQLLGMVERINAEGTAVVLVEQSVNVALSLVSHAYFMEKGEIRFDGPAKQLLERRDLLRSVFLEGAGRALQ